ncbi:probable Phosphatidylinositol 4-kinase PIK1 [Zygosaccharomyces bailii]|nr:probable Phosphatidylinositol 4-kinase PIK1 [Zygosaccharomyces bailii]
MSSGENNISNGALVEKVSNHKEELLLKFINSSHFNIYNCIELLRKHSDNVGIHYYLCQKLLTFPHHELQFYIPQLVQVLLTVETESMALEELLLQLKNENPHFALCTFWQLQALLSELSSDPESYGFQVARRVLNNLQSTLFHTGYDEDESTKGKMNENVAPAIVLCSMIMSSIAMPQVGPMMRPLVESQGKRQKAYVFKLAKNAMRELRRNITIKNTRLNTRSVSSGKNGETVPSSPVDFVESVKTREDFTFRKPKNKEIDLNFDMVDNIGERVFQERISNFIKMPKRRSSYLDDSFVHRTYDQDAVSIYSSTSKSLDSGLRPSSSSLENFADPKNDKFTSSMPNLLDEQTNSAFDSEEKLANSTNASVVEGKLPPPLPRSSSQPPPGMAKRKNRQAQQQQQSSYSKALSKPRDVDPSSLSTTAKIKLLKANYFRCETQFMIALETISHRLAQVPTEARFSALRAELSLLNRDLPAHVDIPTLLPPNKKGKLHKLVLITANEAQVLNSAEKVPFLLLIEYLRDEFDFDPASEGNQEILEQKPHAGTFIFDLNDLGRTRDREKSVQLNALAGEPEAQQRAISNISATRDQLSDYVPSITKEMDLGDISMIKVKNQTDAEAYRESLVLQSAAKVPAIAPDADNRAPELNFVSNLEEVAGPAKSGTRNFRDRTVELADEMRISAVMLAQLDKSPQELSDTANQIRAKIIASMKEVQDKFGYRDLEAIHGTAGERKLENDLKTGGIDISYLGEDWAAKKERIRRTSEYGHLENWDLCSVIAKSGDDLRQEALACQMIQAMAQIWTKGKVDVWVKKMKILITSATTGLVETITNAMSVHSIKKSLTKKMIEDGDLDEKGGIATLNDHFIRAFGDPKGFRYRRAQDNFACSLAAYSLICYLLQIKDRHNGNIMIDNEGHVVHIDFGFMLSNSPGSVGFEAAPFKLTYEYVELLGGINGDAYKKFVSLIQESFKLLRKYADQIVSMCEVMQKDNSQPCFNAGENTSVQLKQRFHLELSDAECDEFVENYLVGKSLGSIYTRLYDQFQLITQGIYS